MNYAVVMAGGIGTRFWPMSTPQSPKQLLKLFRTKTMIELTLDRLEPLIPRDYHRIVTIPDQIELFRKNLKEFPLQQYIIEPFAKNTAPCVGLAAVQLMAQDEDAIMVVLPADHKIGNEEAFRECLSQGIEVVKKTDAIVTLGITPTRPETGYGYIQYEKEELFKAAHKVRTFAEKPDVATAEAFIKTGEFLWNSGIFIWSARKVLAEIEENIPVLYSALREIRDCLGTANEGEKIYKAYQSIKPISIDYGVMENTESAFVIKGDFEWSDVGNWGEVWRLSEKDKNNNTIRGKAVASHTDSSYIYSDDSRPLAVVGMKDVIVVSTEEGTLICPRENVQDVGKAAEEIFKKWKIKR